MGLARMHKLRELLVKRLVAMHAAVFWSGVAKLLCATAVTVAMAVAICSAQQHLLWLWASALYRGYGCDCAARSHSFLHRGGHRASSPE